MDFGSILHAAQQNNSQRKEVKYYPSKFEPPKKETKAKTLSSNIQKFLAKKEAEERRIELEKKRKRDELLAKRDPKLQKKIQKMLKVCKSANKSVLEDAVDHNNTAVTLTGCEQPDEDDYGYVSQEASAYYNKMMEKYLTVPEDEKFPSAKKRSSSDLLGTKDRVRQALIREKEEELLPHKRQRKSKSEGVPYEVDSSKSSSKRNEKDFYREPEKKQESKPKHRRQAPPPLAFDELLKIAEKKAQEPIKIERIIELKKEKEPERLMTSKEKREYEQHKAWMDQRAEREKSKSQNNYRNDKHKNNGQRIIDKNTSHQRDRDRSKEVERLTTKPQSSGPAGRIPKLNGYQTKPMHNGKTSSNNLSDRNYSASNSSKVKEKNNSQKYASPKEESSKLNKSLTAGSRNESTFNKNVHSAQRQSQNSLSASKSNVVPNKNNSHSSSSQNMKPRSSDAGKSRQFPPYSDTKGIRQPSSNGVKPSDKGGNRPPSDKIVRSSTSNNIKGTRPIPSSDIKTTRQFPPPDVKSTRQFPPPDVKGGRQFPPKDVKSTRQFPPQDVRRKQNTSRDGERKPMGRNRRAILDDDSEYDSEIDDFIDDGPEEEEDYSKHIKDIFGYDKTRYRDEDYDDRNMESTFAQQMREEYISKKLGQQEDLEDMRMEEEEKRKMRALAKRKR